MRLTIVRHGYAGEKRTWNGPDLERPLDVHGHRQAGSLRDLLKGHRVNRIVCSPAVRCVQTVEPLATLLHLPIETCPELGPDGRATRIISACFGEPAFDDAVLCTHGELLQQLLQLDDVRRQMRRHNLSRHTLLMKGSAWRLHIAADGRITRLIHHVPLR